MNRYALIELVTAILVVAGLTITAYSLQPAERAMQEQSRDQ